MQEDIYPLTISKTAMAYEFVSIGTKGSIDKLVIYSETEFEKVYNLGFGDKDPRTNKISDTVITNNGDAHKVLLTVASTLYFFTERFKDVLVFLAGSSKSRTRLYRIAISNHFRLISADFEVYGSYHGRWTLFEKNTDYEAFIVKRKKVPL